MCRPPRQADKTMHEEYFCLPAILNFVNFFQILPDALQEVALDQAACDLLAEIRLNSEVSLPSKPVQTGKGWQIHSGINP